MSDIEQTMLGTPARVVSDEEEKQFRNAVMEPEPVWSTPVAKPKPRIGKTDALNSMLGKEEVLKQTRKQANIFKSNRSTIHWQRPTTSETRKEMRTENTSQMAFAAARDSFGPNPFGVGAKPGKKWPEGVRTMKELINEAYENIKPPSRLDAAHAKCYWGLECMKPKSSNSLTLLISTIHELYISKNPRAIDELESIAKKMEQVGPDFTDYTSLYSPTAHQLFNKQEPINPNDVGYCANYLPKTHLVKPTRRIEHLEKDGCDFIASGKRMGKVQLATLANKAEEMAELLNPVVNEEEEEPFIEPILRKTTNRLIMFPIVKHDIWDLYQTHLKAIWFVTEILTAKDVKDLAEMNEGEQHFILHILAYFAGSDGIVNENLVTRFYGEVQLPEARAFLGFQIFMEGIHAETYSLLIDAFVKDPEKKKKLFNAINEIPSIKMKADFAFDWIESAEEYAVRLIAFYSIEGVHFSGSFCAIFWLKKRGKMPGLCHANELISRDEGLHTGHAALLYKELERKLPQYKIEEIFREAIRIESHFCTEGLPVSLIGMNCDLMLQYIKFVADYMMMYINYDKMYGVENPFDWMEMISLDGKTNFFEKSVSEYQNNVEANDTDVFIDDADF